MSAEPAMPTTVEELWDTAWVAENEEEAVAQAERMYDLFRGRRVAVDRLEFFDGDDLDERMFVKPWPEVWVKALSTERGWDGDVLYPEWEVEAADPDQIVTTADGDTYRMGDLGWVNYDDYGGGYCSGLFTTAPGIGTEDGFGGLKDRYIYPVKAEGLPA